MSEAWNQADGSVDGLETARKLGVLKEIIKDRDQKRLTDPEWSIPIPVHTALMVEAFSYGILSADFWFKGYKVPPNFDLVINWIAFNVQRDYPGTFANISLLEYMAKLKEWMDENPWVKEWNDNPKLNNAEERLYQALRSADYSLELNSRPFLCFESAIVNAAVMVEQEWQKRLEFNEYINSQPFELRKKPETKSTSNQG